MTAKIATALLFIGLNFYVFGFMGRDIVVPERTSFAAYPEQLGPWACVRKGEIDDETIGNLGVTDYVLCDFLEADSGILLNLYIGYHERQVRTNEGKETTIHPPEHCLPGSGWDIIASEIVPVDFGIAGEAKRVTIARGNDRSLVYFWYQSRGQVIARDYEKILRMFADRATTGRTDGALVRLTVPIEREGGEVAADARIHAFAEQAMNGLDAYVPN